MSVISEAAPSNNTKTYRGDNRVRFDPGATFNQLEISREAL